MTRIRQDDPFSYGYNPITTMEETENNTMMDFGIFRLAKDQVVVDADQKERAFLLIQGEVSFEWEGKKETAKRKSCFDDDPWVLHVPQGVQVKITGLAETEVCLTKTTNDTVFPAKLYTDKECASEKIGEIGYKSEYQDEIWVAKEKWDREVDRLFSVELANGLSQTKVLGEINKFLREDDIVVGSSGSLPGDLQRVWRPVKPKTYHMEYGFSCMGYEVAGALGAKMAEPEKEVYTMVGDGSYIMLHSELVTSIQERRKINILLFDNNGFGCINNLQRSQGIPSFGTEFRFRSEETGRLTGDYIPIDFAANARSYGAKAYTVTTIDELKDALEKSRQDSVSTLIDIKVLPGTMTEGYESWWRVGVSEVAEREAVLESHKRMADEIKKVRQF